MKKLLIAVIMAMVMMLGTGMAFAHNDHPAPQDGFYTHGGEPITWFNSGDDMGNSGWKFFGTSLGGTTTNQGGNAYSKAKAKAKAEATATSSSTSSSTIGDINNINEPITVFKPVTTVLFESPTQLPNIPSSSLPELTFGNGRMRPFKMPQFAAYGIEEYDPTTDIIRKIVKKERGVKFIDLFSTHLDISAILTKKGSLPGKNIKVIVVDRESNTTRTMGLTVNGGGTGVAASGLAGGAGSGGIGPQWGRTSADDVFDLVYAEVCVAVPVN